MRLTNKELKQYRFHRAQAKVLKIRLGEAYVYTHDVVKSGEPGHTLVIHGMANTPQMRKWHRDAQYHVDNCRAAEEYIASIEDSVTRRIFELRYLEGEKMPTWEDVAAQVGGGNSESAVKMRVTRYLSENM